MWLLAFSGGPDSTGLAVALRDRPVLLGYVDHRMRGALASREERATVKRIAVELGLPLCRTRVSVRGVSEADAREARYEALEAMARRHGCRGILLAQTAEDRAETVLFHLQRGTGLRGLAPMRRRVRIHGVWRVRPAIHQRREDLRRAALAFRPVADNTNRSTATARARTRHLLLPAMSRKLGEDAVPLLCALADHADRARSALEQRAICIPDRRALLRQPAALFPYSVESLRAGPPLTRAAYASLRAYLAAGRGDRDHITPAGDRWRNRPAGAVEITAGAVEVTAGAVEDSAGAVEDSAGAVEDSAGAVEDPAGAVEVTAGAVEIS